MQSFWPRCTAALHSDLWWSQWPLRLQSAALQQSVSTRLVGHAEYRFKVTCNMLNGQSFWLSYVYNVKLVYMWLLTVLLNVTVNLCHRSYLSKWETAVRSFSKKNSVSDGRYLVNATYFQPNRRKKYAVPLLMDFYISFWKVVDPIPLPPESMFVLQYSEELILSSETMEMY